MEGVPCSVVVFIMGASSPAVFTLYVSVRSCLLILRSVCICSVMGRAHLRPHPSASTGPELKEKFYYSDEDGIVGYLFLARSVYPAARSISRRHSTQHIRVFSLYVSFKIFIVASTQCALSRWTRHLSTPKGPLRSLQSVCGEGCLQSVEGSYVSTHPLYLFSISV